MKIQIKASSPAYGEALTYSLSLYTSSHLRDSSSAMAPANPAHSLLHEMLAACKHSPYFVFQLPIILGKSCQYFFHYLCNWEILDNQAGRIKDPQPESNWERIMFPT